MPAEIGAGDLFPVPRFVQHEDPLKGAARHRDLLAQALNEVASAAFSVSVLHDSSTSTLLVNSTTPATYSGLSLDVICPVPSSVEVKVSVDVRAATWTAVAQGSFIGRILRNGVVVAEGLFSPGIQGGRIPFALGTAQLDLLPRTLYSYTFEALLSSAGTNVFSINAGNDALRAQMTAVVLPRILT